jgi:hypothetical protein
MAKGEVVTSRDVTRLLAKVVADVMTGRITPAEAKRINAQVKIGRGEVTFRGRRVRLER